MTRREKAFMTELRRSRRMRAFCFDGPWQSKQFSRRIGRISLAKSTFAGDCADKLKLTPKRHRVSPQRLNPTLLASVLFARYFIGPHESQSRHRYPNPMAPPTAKTGYRAAASVHLLIGVLRVNNILIRPLANLFR